MSDEELAKAAEAFAEVTKECGESVIAQGDIGDEFFIISSGRALVLFHVSDDGRLIPSGYLRATVLILLSVERPMGAGQS